MLENSKIMIERAGYLVLVGALCVGVMLWLKPERVNLDGTWVSSDAKQRWRLQIQRDRVRWVERGIGDSLLESESVVDTSSGEFRLERDNDEHVLQFLGFACDRLEGVLESRPKPSFMILHHQDGRLEAQWYGILAILDEKGAFAGVKQPGDAPPEMYQLARIE